MGAFPLHLSHKSILKMFSKTALKSFSHIFLATTCTTKASKYVLQLLFYHHVGNRVDFLWHIFVKELARSLAERKMKAVTVWALLRWRKQMRDGSWGRGKMKRWRRLDRNEGSLSHCHWVRGFGQRPIENMSNNAGMQHISNQERRSWVTVSCWRRKGKSHKEKESKAVFDEVLEVI